MVNDENNAHNDGVIALGRLWATDKVTAEQVIAFAHTLESITTTEVLGLPAHSYHEPQRLIPLNAPKAGVKQVW